MQLTGEICKRAIQEELHNMSGGHSEVFSQRTTIEKVSREDMALLTIETELAFASLNISCAHEQREKELLALLGKIEKGQFDFHCRRCGAPMSAEMFQAHPSDCCPPCRAKQIPQLQPHTRSFPPTHPPLIMERVGRPVHVSRSRRI